MTSQATRDRTDASILLALLGTRENDTMKNGKLGGLTGNQIRYRLTCAGLIVVGGIGAIFGHAIPWEWAQTTVKEIGSGFLIAGILASFVEPFFKREFAQDAFLAAFRRVLPDEFKDEVEKILRFEFIAEEQVWSVKIEKIPDTEVVRVTTSFARTSTNKSKSDRAINCHYEVEDFKFCEGKTQIFECGIRGDGGADDIRESTIQIPHPAHVEMKTDYLTVKPGKTFRVWGRAVQYRRTDDCIWENFRVPIKNPVIEVDIDENEFWFDAKFGTPGKKTKLEYRNRYTLEGIYFPGQFMFVRWGPKKSATKEITASRPQLPETAGADQGRS